MKRYILPLLAFSLVVCVTNAPAFAKGRHHQVPQDVMQNDEPVYSEGRTNWGRHGDNFSGVGFDDYERESIHSYFQEEHHRKCPPGLAKKNKRCMPPGLSKKYVVGGILPSAHRAPPAILLQRLGPPPAGTFYTMVDNDVLLAVEGTKKILDAVTLFSAIQ